MSALAHAAAHLHSHHDASTAFVVLMVLAIAGLVGWGLNGRSR